MQNGQTTPEEKAIVAKFNEHGSEVTENAMARYVPTWFANARELIRANFKLQSIEALVVQFSPFARSIVIMGSGPSAMQIASDLPRDDPSMIVLCGPTGIGALLINGRSPNVVVVADSAPEQYSVIAEHDPDNIANWKFLLPVTANPLWYSESSIIKREQLYFYLPYLDTLGTVKNAYNDILKALFPDVHNYISQAGSVGNTSIGFADMIAGENRDARIYLGLDCCGWLNPTNLRAPAGLKHLDGSYTAVITERQKNQAAEEMVNELVVDYHGSGLKTNLTSLGYAVQMLYLVHFLSHLSPNRDQRFIFLVESAKLFCYAAPDEIIPLVHAFEVGMGDNPIAGEEWAYNIMLKLIAITVEHREACIARTQEDNDGQD